MTKVELLFWKECPSYPEALALLEQVLRERGYAPGDPAIPSPHEHHYNKQYDKLEQDLWRLWAWNRILPLDTVPED